jgi:signal transduction histidine kinase
LRAHGGDLQLEQSGAQGTMFAIQLPGCARP